MFTRLKVCVHMKSRGIYAHVCVRRFRNDCPGGTQYCKSEPRWAGGTHGVCFEVTRLSSFDVRCLGRPNGLAGMAKMRAVQCSLEARPVRRWKKSQSDHFAVIGVACLG